MYNIKILDVLKLLSFLISITCPAQDVKNIMIRVVYVTPDWLPYSTEDAFLRAAPLKETPSLKYYDVAIWEENKSIQLYSIPNNYFDNRLNIGDSAVEAYRESFAIAKFDGLPEGFGSIERSEFLKNAMDSFISIIVKLHPNASHHLEFNGHGAPGGQLFSGFLLPQHVKEFLAFWNQELGHKLGVIDMGGPCNIGDFTTMEAVCKYADYYIASDLTNGNYQMDNWTIEKYEETEPDFQYHRLFSDYPTLFEALKERINLKRRSYEYSREYMIIHEVQQANYLYSCQNFIAFSNTFKAYMLKNNMDFYNSTYTGDPNYSMYGDLYSFLLNQNNDSLLALFDKIILYQANNRDFFEWKGSFNGIISPFRYGKLTLNMVPPYAELQTYVMAEANKPISIEVNAYDIEQNELAYTWQQLSGPPVSLENNNSERVTLTVPKFYANNILKLEVLVGDGEYSVSDTISVLCLVANAGPDQTVSESLIVELDGSGSYNPQGNPITYKWSAPDGIALSSTNEVQTTFTAPEVSANQNLTFSLVVNDGMVDSPVDEVVITVQHVNKAPIAYAGTDQSINEGETVNLNGSTSTDPDGDPLTYKWYAPVGITLSSTTTPKPNFTTPEVQKDSILKFSLVVNDGSVDSNPSTVNISILNLIKVGNKEISKAVFNVYPNPSTGIITIEINQNSRKKSEICVSKLIGAEVFRMDLSHTNNYQVDLSNQVSGIYLLKITIDNQQYINKIIIQK